MNWLIYHDLFDKLIKNGSKKQDLYSNKLNGFFLSVSNIFPSSNDLSWSRYLGEQARCLFPKWEQLQGDF